ncbi:MAG: helix-turn-helix domain-containing protein [Candidatus Merdivicinus sp.]|jgi:AraC-like DNA-binding protein/ubiquinone/menaquinone biosynthesis C-methylase UbiE
MEPIKIQKIIDYIEENLTGTLSYDAIAAMMAVSEADLQRSFKVIAGLTISEYIRYRRLTQAALDLKNSGSKVLDVALTYGYRTAESFSKAFKQYHGCTPMEAKNTNQIISYFNPIVIKLAKKGGNVTECDASHLEKADTVMAFYDASDEHCRLTKSKHSKIEYLITMKYLKAVIPENSRILDCCAGTGVYAFELAKRHQVVAGDLSEKHVNKMWQLQKESPILREIHRLDVCSMSVFEDESFDVVLCMGALYHLFDCEKRMNAIRECVRVCKKQGILVFAYLNKWGSFYNGVINNLKSLELLYNEFDSGNHEDVFFRTTTSEMDETCQMLHLKCLYNIGVDHLAFLFSERIDTMSDLEYERLLDYQMKATQDPNIAGVSLHGLWIGTK